MFQKIIYKEFPVLKKKILRNMKSSIFVIIIKIIQINYECSARYHYLQGKICCIFKINLSFIISAHCINIIINPFSFLRINLYYFQRKFWKKNIFPHLRFALHKSKILITFQKLFGNA